MSCLMFDDEEVAGLVPKGESVSVTADGVKTLSTLLNELYALIDTTRLSEGSYAEIRVPSNNQHTIFRYEYMGSSFDIYCSMSLVTTGGAEINTIAIKSTGSTRKSAIGSSVTDESSRVYPSGATVKFYY